MVWFLASLLKMDFLLLLLTFSAASQTCHHTGEPCPTVCACSSSGTSGLEVSCSNASLTHFPTECLPLDTRELSIQSTNLSEITASHLRGVPQLKNLQLYHNKLKLLPADILRHVSSLEVLDLTGNQLVSLPPNIFHHSALRSLILKNNLMEKLDAEWFSDNNALTWLDLSVNRLAELPHAFLQNLKHLKILDLSQNQLRVIPPDSLKNLLHLETLNLSGNKLSTLNASTFSHNRRLVQLFLQENDLHHLPATIFQGLHGLEMILLTQNKLQHLNFGLLDDQNSTRFQLLLSMNHWSCDRQIEYLWKWICDHPHRVVFLQEVLCSGPAALENRQVVSLTRAEIMS
ncbi:leucine-rich alpha-2-glycoprotein-like [Synchiropus splendidus]|uniref:leucine-rich alpha-2-glycoprotein-like n=1 Tax=Synchiropus splendidus TaxID=270530 RepID=UPI00237D9473|nr:leucine-rich alpha-2-glycoprotein-like [Synchiropus splendidus]